MPKTRATKPDLRKFTETELIIETGDILNQPGEITPRQKKQLDRINREFQRREAEEKNKA